MTYRPVPGAPPGNRAHFWPRYATRPAEIVFTATCDRCPRDATWRKGKDAVRPTCTCTCTCQPGESVA